MPDYHRQAGQMLRQLRKQRQLTRIQAVALLHMSTLRAGIGNLLGPSCGVYPIFRATVRAQRPRHDDWRFGLSKVYSPGCPLGVGTWSCSPILGMYLEMAGGCQYSQNMLS
jgi:hypothetical protein